MRYTVIENKFINKILQTVPRGDGTLPIEPLKALPEWKELLKTRDEKSLIQHCQKVWRKSILQIEPKKRNPELNHAFNFCPNCGMTLNTLKK